MYTKTFLLFSLAGAALAEPIPQADPNSSDDFGAAATSGFGAVPSFDSASLSSELASVTAALSIYSDLPTLPASIASFFATAATDTSGLDPCATTEPGWLKSLPESVKSAFTSYESALESWYSEHSTDLPTTSSYTGSLPSYTASSYTGLIPTYTGNACSSVAQTRATPTKTGTPAATDGATGASTGASTGSGGETTAAPASSTAAKGSAASGTSSHGSAARPTGAIAAGFAGLVGMVGLMVAL